MVAVGGCNVFVTGGVTISLQVAAFGVLRFFVVIVLCAFRVAASEPWERTHKPTALRAACSRLITPGKVVVSNFNQYATMPRKIQAYSHS